MNRKHRNLLAENLRHYLSGRITNFEFMDNIEMLSWTRDNAVIAIEGEFWIAYDDIREHHNEGKHKLNQTDEDHVKRFILFLKSDNEYKWSNPKLPSVFKQILNLFGIKTKSDRLKEEVDKKGNTEVWPFYDEVELQKEINEPKYLNENIAPQQCV